MVPPPFVRGGKADSGDVAGAILLAREVENPSQPSLAAIDMRIERNAYGRQSDSRSEWSNPNRCSRGVRPGSAGGRLHPSAHHPFCGAVRRCAVVWRAEIQIWRSRAALRPFHAELTDDTVWARIGFPLGKVKSGPHR